MFTRQLCGTCSKTLTNVSGWRYPNIFNQYARKRTISQATITSAAAGGGAAVGLRSVVDSVITVHQVRRFSQIMEVRKNGSGFIESSTFLDHSSIRSFSSQRKNESKFSDALINEALISELRRTFPNAQGPEDMEVRLVIDEGPEEPATVKVCSLAEAIEVSLDRMTDLIAISLKNDPPVIRAVRLSKLEYEQKDKHAANKKAANKSKLKKTFRFRAGIDTNDLNRKIQDMTKFLEDGVECEYTVFSKARMLRENSDAGKELVERIQGLVSHCAVQKRAPQENEVGNHIRIALMPKKSK